MKRRTYGILLALLLSANPLYAAGSAAESTGSSTAEAGSATATSTSQAQGIAQAAGGAIIEGFNHSFTFEASTAPPYMPNTLGAPVLGPTLFNFMGRPAQVNGIPILANNMIIPSVHEVATGNSYGTKIVYNGITLPKKQEKNEGKIQFNLSGRAFGQVVGSITIQSRKNKGDEVDLSTLIYDTAMYIGERKDLKSYNVTLLSVPQGISYAMGVDSKGNGFSLSPVISGLINGPTGVMAGAASGLASSRGITAPTGLIGCTFLVLIESENAVGVDLLANYTNGFSQKDQDENNGNGNGNGHKNGNGVKKKKYDSVEK